MERRKNTFIRLAFYMVGFGLGMGIVFPFFTIVLGVAKETALSEWFIASCVLAGVLVGFVNIAISRVIVKKRLHTVTSKMKEVKDTIISVSDSGNITQCNPEHCAVPVETQDEFGSSAQAFNELIAAFASSLRTLDEIKTFTATFSCQLDLQSLAEHALNLAQSSSGAQAGAILADQDGEIRLLQSKGIDEAKTLENDESVLKVFAKGERIHARYPKNVVVNSTLTQFLPSEVVIEPILYKSIPIAVVLLAKADAFDPDNLRKMPIFTQSLAVALHNAFDHEQLQKLAALDPLTGVLNRRFGMVRLHEEYARSVRKDIPLGVIMLDIDHFKMINDTYGHVAGDRVLKNLAFQIRQGMRDGDVLMRYGGEEFVLILPGAAKGDTFAVAERIRHIVTENKTTYGDSSIQITISAGCDAFPETPIKEESELIKNADKAMYRSKHSGRNRTTVH
jgi:diguanylate cyclase (GGDEF)-like protein